MSKLVPKLRFKEFSGKIELKSLKEVIISNTYGPRFNANDYNINGNVKTIRGTDISLDGNILYQQVPTAELDEKFIKNHILEDGDLVMITTADCGLTGIYEAQTDKYICSAYAVKITLNKSLAFPLYFKYFFQTAIAKYEINKYIRKAIVGNLPASDILKISHNVPTLPEQQKIASTFSSLDNLIEAQNKKVEALKKHKKGLIQGLFPKDGEKVPKLRFDGFFGEWEEKKLNDIVKVFKGKGISKNDIIKNGTLECIRYGELYTYYREIIKDIKSKTNLNQDNLILSKKNDIIIPSSGETSIDIATASCVMKDNVALGGDLNILRGKENGIFLAYYLSSAKKYEIAKLAQGIAVVHLYASQLINLKLKLPSIDEQQKIASCLSSLDNLIEVQNKKIEALKKHKKGLMQGLFVNKEITK